MPRFSVVSLVLFMGGNTNCIICTNALMDKHFRSDIAQNSRLSLKFIAVRANF